LGHDNGLERCTTTYAAESESDGGARGWLDGGDKYEIWHAAAALAVAANAEKGSGAAGRVWKSAAAEGPSKAYVMEMLPESEKPARPVTGFVLQWRYGKVAGRTGQEGQATEIEVHICPSWGRSRR